MEKNLCITLTITIAGYKVRSFFPLLRVAWFWDLNDFIPWVSEKQKITSLFFFTVNLLTSVRLTSQRWLDRNGKTVRFRIGDLYFQNIFLTIKIAQISYSNPEWIVAFKKLWAHWYGVAFTLRKINPCFTCVLAQSKSLYLKCSCFPSCLRPSVLCKRPRFLVHQFYLDNFDFLAQLITNATIWKN